MPGTNPLSSVGNTIPQGKYTISTPGVFASTHYGLPKTDTDYTMHVTLNLEFADLLAMTHDPAMIWFLRAFLNDSTIDPFTTYSSNMPSGVTPMRYKELAANAISRLLGEPEMFDPWKRQKTGGPYPEWGEWDKQIALLQQRLDAMPKP
jgi:hypothetical protein